MAVVQSPTNTKLRRSKHKKAKAISFMETLNLDNDDQFSSTVHNQATAIEQSLINSHGKAIQEGDDASSDSEPTPSPSFMGHKGTSSINSFAALHVGQDDDDDRSVTIASCDSDTDEGQVEPIDVGHHPANDSFPS